MKTLDVSIVNSLYWRRSKRSYGPVTMYNFFVRGRLIINLPAAGRDGIRHLLLGRRLVFFLEMLQEHKNYAQQLNLLYITPQVDILSPFLCAHSFTVFWICVPK